MRAASSGGAVSLVPRIVALSDPVAVAIYDDPVAQARALEPHLGEGASAGLERRALELVGVDVLDVHARIEETIFYPELKKADETRDITLEAFEEHRLVKQLLGELEEMDKGAEEWTAKFTVLKENVEHHVEEEEGEMFPKARKVSSEEQAEIIGTRMEAEKEKELKVAAAA